MTTNQNAEEVRGWVEMPTGGTSYRYQWRGNLFFAEAWDHFAEKWHPAHPIETGWLRLIADRDATIQQLQAELHDVRQAIADQCGPEADLCEGRMGSKVYFQCKVCGFDWWSDEVEVHEPSCIYSRSRQALAAEGGEGA